MDMREEYFTKMKKEFEASEIKQLKRARYNKAPPRRCETSRAAARLVSGVLDKAKEKA